MMFLFLMGRVHDINAIIKTTDLSFYNEFGVLTLNAKQFDTGRKFILILLKMMKRLISGVVKHISAFKKPTEHNFREMNAVKPKEQTV